MDSSKTESYKLAFEQASKGLQSQVATVDNARTRLGVLMGGGNLATAFLGRDALTVGLAGDFNLLFWAGVAAFVAFAAVCLWGILPRADWVFSLSAASIAERIEGDGMDIGEIYKDLAMWQERHFDANAVRLEGLFRVLQLASVALVAELALFLLVVSGVSIP